MVLSPYGFLPFPPFRLGLSHPLRGRGLITVPVLLNLGLPPQLALGTNKFQASFGSVSAAIHYSKGKAVDLNDCWLGVALTACGSLLGTTLVQVIDPQILGKIIPWLLGAIVVYMLAKPKVGQHSCPPQMAHGPFFILFGLLLGFYDGFFGPGTGSFWTVALVLLLGRSFLNATGVTKVMNATSNVTSLAVFAVGGQVALDAGLTMAGGQVLGARVGSKLVMKKGSRFVQPIFFTMVALVIARLVWVNYLE
ncbi:MAG: TSUP family transporter [Opitutaceae bacterium]|nr:TSUP family transporter [Opitutaceae bacterium]